MKFTTLIPFLGVSSISATNLFDCDIEDFYRGFDPSDYNTADALKAALHSYIDGHKIIPYGSTDEAMKIIDASPDGRGIIGVYCQEPRYVFPDEWNREHVWPRSRGIGDSGADTSDLFHLYPSDLNLNSARGNKYFDECTPGVGGCVSPAGTSTEDAAPGTTEDSNTWSPPPNMRGDLARAIFYLATRYDGSDSSTTRLQVKECASESSCGANTFGRLSTLLKWHRDDPVSSQERARADAICRDYQGNRNPFVDFPELAEEIFGNGKKAERSPDGNDITVTVEVHEDNSNVLGFSVVFFLVIVLSAFARKLFNKKQEEKESKEVYAATL